MHQLDTVLRRFATPETWSYFNDKKILITGGTGSFGTAMVRNLLRQASPDRLVVFSRDELKQYDMTQALAGMDPRGVLRFFIGDVRDAARLEMAFRGIDLVIHTAALKQVPTAEYNPFECIHTNVLGAENVVQAAIKSGVKRVVALSTDKAASPINLYGASKLASDKIFVAANHLSGSGGPRFSVVRYGNVIGSRGSVVPLYRRLLAEGADHLPITDARMTRFWITLEQGIAFVASCMGMMKGGELFVPKIPSMKVIDLAEAMAPDIEKRVVGIRPGEKLHEVMVTEDDWRNTLQLEDRYVIEPAFSFWKRNAAPYNHDATPVEEGFVYASHTNSEWLSAAEARRMIADCVAHEVVK
ncbi:MAG: UDP-N-acetylglucosamine 4,6-dehydratase (inverting) [Kiloniellales bacterium]